MCLHTTLYFSNLFTYTPKIAWCRFNSPPPGSKRRRPRRRLLEAIFETKLLIKLQLTGHCSKVATYIFLHMWRFTNMADNCVIRLRRDHSLWPCDATWRHTSVNIGSNNGLVPCLATSTICWCNVYYQFKPQEQNPGIFQPNINIFTFKKMHSNVVCKPGAILFNHSVAAPTIQQSCSWTHTAETKKRLVTSAGLFGDLR